MKDELNKKIRELCEDAGSQAALRMIPVLTADLDREYDKRIEAGMVELDAYRDVLRSVDRIEAMLRSLPKDGTDTAGEPQAEEEGPEERQEPESRKEKERKNGGSRSKAAGRGEDVLERLAEEEERRKGLKTLEFYSDKVSALLWVGTTLVYFLMSLRFGIWSWSWLIFLWATLGQILLSAAVDYNKHLNLKKTYHETLSGCLWVGATLLFFIGGFFLHQWKYAWLIFLAATLGQILMETAFADRAER